MDKPLLRNPEEFPDERVLRGALGESFGAYEQLIAAITADDYGLTPEWRFYRDGNSWLCKTSYKNKTVFWLSVWDGYFSIGFYFTEKTSAGVEYLNIARELKDDLLNAKRIGRLIPLIIKVADSVQIRDILKIAAYKKNLK